MFSSFFFVLLISPVAGSTSNTRRKEKKKDKTMPSQQHVSSGGINVTMMSDPPGSSSAGDRYEAPTIPAPPPPPMAGVNESRIYARPEHIQSSAKTQMSFANRFAPAGSPYERVQVLPVGPEKLFGRVVSPPPPPQSPTYKSSSGYQSGLHNGGGVAAPTAPTAPVTIKPDYQRNLSSDSAVKRATSFNQHSTPNPYYNSLQNPRYHRMSTSREEINSTSAAAAHHKESALSARQTFLNSLNTTTSSNNVTNYHENINNTTAADRKVELLPTYSTPIVKRWPPPPKPIDDDEDNENDIGYIRTSTPKGGTVIRLGPTPVNRIERTQSMNTNQSANTPRMNMINSSLQSVPEREKKQQHHQSQPAAQPQSEYHRKKTPPQPLGFFIDTDRSFRGLSPVRTDGETPPSGGKVVQTYYAKTSPPPRPAPPVSNRTSESFRIPRTAPMFSDQLTSPPVRPVRRNKSVLINKKTDSGTQTMQRKEIMSQTLDRPTSKPMKQYYMGEDPFAPQKANGWVTGVNTNSNNNGLPTYQAQEPPQRPGRTEVIRSQTMPRRPSRPLQESTVYSVQQQQNTSNLSSTSRVFSDQDRSMNETTRASEEARYRSSVITNVNSNYQQPTPAVIKTSTQTVASPLHGKMSNNPVNRSQSFQQPQPQTTGHRNSLTSASSIRRMSQLGLGSASNNNKTSSPLYKSTSFLNRMDSSNQQTPSAPFSSLKSPGIVTSISKSQLELNKSNTELNMFGRQPVQQQQSTTITPTFDANSALYTLPRRHSRNRITPEKTIVAPPPPMPAASLTENSVSRGESFSSMHRRRMQQEAQQQQQQQQQQSTSEQMSFNASTKATHRSFRTIDEETTTTNTNNNNNNNSNADPATDPANKSLKERIALLESAGGMHYANPVQTLPRVVAEKTKKGPPPPPPPRVSSAKKSPESPDGDKKQKFLEGLLNTAPELFMHIHGDENLKGINVEREDVIDSRSNRRPSPPSNNNNNSRIFTSSPPLMNDPMTPPPMLIRHPAAEALATGHSRRGSLTSTGSAGGVIIAAVKIPAPVNYSETVRIKSNQDPDRLSDSVQSYSKRVQPFVDGFSSETNHSSQQTTHTRSQYTTSAAAAAADDHYDSPANSHPYSIRPQQSGGVIITVRGNDQ